MRFALCFYKGYYKDFGTTPANCDDMHSTLYRLGHEVMNRLTVQHNRIFCSVYLDDGDSIAKAVTFMETVLTKSGVLEPMKLERIFVSLDIHRPADAADETDLLKLGVTTRWTMNTIPHMYLNSRENEHEYAMRLALVKRTVLKLKLMRGSVEDRLRALFERR